ncbi:hypothetical protein K439DRAFT_1256786, partial [Ramaria rubella]
CKATDTSTGNFRKHAQRCTGPSTTSTIMDKFAAGCTYSHESLCWKLLTWVMQKNWPYTIIDDAEFHDILVILHGSVNIPSTKMLAGDIQMAHDISKAKLIQVLEVHTGKVHTALDVWTSCKASSYLSL